jgi:CRP-like cAMP-binding protein
LLAIRGPGDLIGELGALEQIPRFGTATALEQVEALVVPATVFRKVVAENPAAAGVVMQMLGHRLRDSDRKRAEFGTRGSGARVAARLLELADRFGVRVDEGIRIDLPLTQDELALWTGCSREAVTKAMQAMRESRWVKTGRRSIVIVDEEALRDWSPSNSNSSHRGDSCA